MENRIYWEYVEWIKYSYLIYFPGLLYLNGVYILKTKKATARIGNKQP